MPPPEKPSVVREVVRAEQEAKKRLDELDRNLRLLKDQIQHLVSLLERQTSTLRHLALECKVVSIKEYKTLRMAIHLNKTNLKEARAFLEKGEEVRRGQADELTLLQAAKKKVQTELARTATILPFRKPTNGKRPRKARKAEQRP